MRFKNTDALPLVEQGETPNPLGNTMRDRLIEFLETVYKNPKVRCPRSDELTCDGCKYDLGDHCDISAIIADHLLANGVIVPPVKVGQTVWFVSKWEGCVKPIQVISCEITNFGTFNFACWGGDFTPTEFNAEAIGKTVFLTREEAEAALAERSEG